MSIEAQEQMMTRIKNKIRNNLDDIILTEGHELEDAEIVIVSYGISARTSMAAMQQARAMGFKVGFLRLVTIWPFAEKQIRELAERVKALVTVEINLGQIHLEVTRAAAGQADCHLVGHPGGAIISPDKVLAVIKEVA
jgi:2-oxoglutarate ferredoxin oxidoreductase subunit alpha